MTSDLHNPLKDLYVKKLRDERLDDLSYSYVCCSDITGNTEQGAQKGGTGANENYRRFGNVVSAVMEQVDRKIVF